MRRAWDSIAMLLVYVALIAVGLAALRVSSRLWANVGFSVAVTSLVVAIAVAVYRRGSRRAFWVGYAVFGWAYLIMAFGLSPFTPWRDLLVTTPVLVILEDYLQDPIPPAPPGRPIIPAAARTRNAPFVELTPWSHWTASDRSNPFSSDSFNRIGHSFFCLAIALGGGVFCRFLYLSRDEPSPSP